MLKDLINHHIEEEEEELFDLARRTLGDEGLSEVESPYREREEKNL